MEKIKIKLTDTSIECNITTESKSENYIPDIELVLDITEKSDKPINEIAKQDLESIISKATNIDELQRSGYEFAQYKEEDMVLASYKFKNTDNIIIVNHTGVAITDYLLENENVVLQIIAPASVLCPELIGKNGEAFEDNGILFLPGDNEFSYDDIAVDCGEPIINNGVITEDCLISIVCKNVIGEEEYNRLVNKYVKNKKENDDANNNYNVLKDGIYSFYGCSVTSDGYYFYIIGDIFSMESQADMSGRFKVKMAQDIYCCIDDYDCPMTELFRQMSENNVPSMTINILNGELEAIEAWTFDY